MYYGIFVSYKLNEMLDFLKENMISIYNKYQELITNNCVINTCAFQRSATTVYNEVISDI